MRQTLKQRVRDMFQPQQAIKALLLAIGRASRKCTCGACEELEAATYCIVAGGALDPPEGFVE